jgi:hypothetical protein
MVEIEAAAAGCPSGGARWQEEGVGAQERAKGQMQGLWVAFVGRGGEEGRRPGVMAINGHGGGRRFQIIQEGERLD